MATHLNHCSLASDACKTCHNDDKLSSPTNSTSETFCYYFSSTGSCSTHHLDTLPAVDADTKIVLTGNNGSSCGPFIACRSSSSNSSLYNTPAIGGQIALTSVNSDHDKIYPIHMTIIIIHTIIYTLKHLLNLNRFSASLFTWYFLIVSMVIAYNILTPLLLLPVMLLLSILPLSYYSYRMHSDYNNLLVVIINTMRQLLLANRSLYSSLVYNDTSTHCSPITHSYSRAFTSRGLLLPSYHHHLLLSLLSLLSTVSFFILLNVFRYTLLHHQVLTQFTHRDGTMNFLLTIHSICTHDAHLCLFITLPVATVIGVIYFLMKVSTRTSDKWLTTIHLTINLVELNLFIILSSGQFLTRLLMKFIYSSTIQSKRDIRHTKDAKSSVKSMHPLMNDKFCQLISVTWIVVMLATLTRVHADDDLNKIGIIDPRVITYPGDLNFALFVDGHESIDRKSVKRNGRSFVDSVNDVRSLPTPSTGSTGTSSTSSSSSSSSSSTSSSSSPLECSGKINSDGVLKAMSAIWAAHQVNIRRSRSKTSDSIKIGVSLFDSCSSPIVIQRQSVRMISSSLFSPSPSLSNGKLCQASSGKTVQPIIFGMSSCVHLSFLLRYLFFLSSLPLRPIIAQITRFFFSFASPLSPSLFFTSLDTCYFHQLSHLTTLKCAHSC